MVWFDVQPGADRWREVIRVAEAVAHAQRVDERARRVRLVVQCERAQVAQELAGSGVLVPLKKNRS